jgi:hypothetical protein
MIQGIANIAITVDSVFITLGYYLEGIVQHI